MYWPNTKYLVLLDLNSLVTYKYLLEQLQLFPFEILQLFFITSIKVSITSLFYNATTLRPKSNQKHYRLTFWTQTRTWNSVNQLNSLLVCAPHLVPFLLYVDCSWQAIWLEVFANVVIILFCIFLHSLIQNKYFKFKLEKAKQ